MIKTQRLPLSSRSDRICRAGANRAFKGVAIALGIAAALAQQAYAQQGGSAAGTSAGVLEEVIVTAQRRAERIQDVPIAITALSSDQLTRAGVHDLGGIEQLTPALRFDNSGAWAQPTIRGVGSALVTAGGGSNVGIYVDNFYLANPLSVDMQLLNVESVQVLKGPQGTLFGHNTTGGAILVTTKQPSHDTGGMVGMSYGNYNSQRYEGYFTTGLGDKVAVDVAGVLSKGDGYVHDIVTGSDKDGRYQNWTTRVGLKADITDNFSLLFRYQHADVDDASSFLFNAYKLNGVAQTAGAAFNNFPIPGIIPPAVYTTNPHEVAGLTTAYRAKSDAYQLTLTADLGFATLKSFTQYRTLKAFVRHFNISMTALNPAPGLYIPLAQINIPYKPGHTATQEFLLTSNSDGRLQWTAGLFYLDWKDAFGAELSAATPPSAQNPQWTASPYTTTGRASTETYSYAGYADATYQLLDNLYLSAGVRYSVDKVKNAYYRDFFDNTTVPPSILANDLPTLDGDRWTPRAVIRYTPTADSSVYFSFSRGYKSGMYNTGGAQDRPVKPETINAYEVGYKFAAQRLSFDLATYYYNYKDLQVAAYTVVGTSTPVSVVYNAQKARVYGVEGQMQYEITSNFSVNAGAAYTNAKYEKFQGSPTFTQCLELSCGTNYGIFIASTTDLHNAHMVRAPKFTGNLGARYTMGLFGGDLALSGNFYYTSKVYFDSSNVYSQNGYKLLDLRVQWTDPSGMYTLALWGKNVLDTKYMSSNQATPAGIGATWGTPATYGLEAKVHF